MNILSKFQLTSSHGLGVMMFKAVAVAVAGVARLYFPFLIFDYCWSKDASQNTHGRLSLNPICLNTIYIFLATLHY